METQEQKFWNPYLAGVILGLVLLASFLIMGQGLGASGAVFRIGVGMLNTVAPEHVAHTEHMRSVVAHGSRALDNFYIYLLAGAFLGGLVSSYSAGRLKLGIQRGPRISVGLRLALALAGGIMMGFAARMTRGCTSGQALSGGALMSVGSWVFMLSVFAGGYAVAWFVRRQWT